jgi:hypothetical protein
VQSIADGTDVAVNLNNKVEDPWNFLAASPSAFLTVPANCAGLYVVSGTITYQGLTGASGNRIAKVHLNGVQQCFFTGAAAVAQAPANTVSYSCLVRVVTGDQIALVCRHNQGASVTIDGSIGAGIAINLCRVAL